MFVDFSSSPVLSLSFSLISLQVVHLRLEYNDLLVIYAASFFLMPLVRNRHVREEEDSGHSHSDQLYEENDEDLEGDEGGNEGGKTSLDKLVEFC